MQPPGPDGLGRGQVRRHPRPAPRSGARSGSTRATCTTSAASSRRSSRRAADLDWDGHPRRRDPRLAGRRRAAVPRAPGAARPQGRRRRRSAREVPVIFVAFDVLGLGRRGDGAVSSRCCAQPLRERRRPPRRRSACRSAERGRPLRAESTSIRSTPIDGLEAAFAEARARRNEGLMVKDPQSGYSPGRRGLGWLKMKKALATIDCVVVGVEVGPRQAPRRAERLHVRRARRRDTTSSSPSARPTAA